jgi:FMN phosphatase YigB (HAD superfamily)
VITTLLFDLDDTLLASDMAVFLPAYFKALAPYFPQSNIIPALIAGTQAMITKTDPAGTLYEVFSAVFSAQTGLAPAQWEPVFDQFYAETYPHLQALTAPRPTARPLVEWALTAGYTVAIATSPVFPLIAIRQRLAWAGLTDLPFADITHLHAHHFGKPRPEYFAEMLARLGKRPDEVLMIGNDWVNDLAASAAVGLAHYHITNPERDNGRHPLETAVAGATVTEAAPVGTGTLDEFWAWAKAHLPNVPPYAAAPQIALPAQLAGNLAAFLGRTQPLTLAQWRAHSAPEEWSPTEIVCHLRDVEVEVHTPRIRLVTETPNPFLSSAITDPWAVERNYPAQDGPSALSAFETARRATLAFVQNLPATAWQRPARHAIFGPTHLAEIVAWALDHDRLHLTQLAQALQSQQAPRP